MHITKMANFCDACQLQKNNNEYVNSDDWLIRYSNITS